MVMLHSKKRYRSSTEVVRKYLEPHTIPTNSQSSRAIELFAKSFECWNKKPNTTEQESKKMNEEKNMNQSQHVFTICMLLAGRFGTYTSQLQLILTT